MPNLNENTPELNEVQQEQLPVTPVGPATTETKPAPKRRKPTPKTKEPNYKLEHQKALEVIEVMEKQIQALQDKAEYYFQDAKKSKCELAEYKLKVNAAAGLTSDNLRTAANALMVMID